MQQVTSAGNVVAHVVALGTHLVRLPRSGIRAGAAMAVVLFLQAWPAVRSPSTAP